MEDDPIKSSPWRFADALNNGRLLHDSLGAAEHYRDVLRAIEILEPEDLAHLALYVAADAVASRGEEQRDANVWPAWWKGIDSLDEDAGETTPGMLWPIVRPVVDDDLGASPG